jgi:hypothetical protein
LRAEKTTPRATEAKAAYIETHLSRTQVHLDQTPKQWTENTQQKSCHEFLLWSHLTSPHSSHHLEFPLRHTQYSTRSALNIHQASKPTLKVALFSDLIAGLHCSFPVLKFICGIALFYILLKELVSIIACWNKSANPIAMLFRGLEGDIFFH